MTLLSTAAASASVPEKLDDVIMVLLRRGRFSFLDRRPRRKRASLEVRRKDNNPLFLIVLVVAAAVVVEFGMMMIATELIVLLFDASNSE